MVQPLIFDRPLHLPTKQAPYQQPEERPDLSQPASQVAQRHSYDSDHLPARPRFEYPVDHANVSVLAPPREVTSKNQIVNIETPCQPPFQRTQDNQPNDLAEQRNSAHVDEMLSGTGAWATIETNSPTREGSDILSFCPYHSKLLSDHTQGSEASAGLDQSPHQQCLTELSSLTLRPLDDDALDSFVHCVHCADVQHKTRP
ncbi:MAG: hypothetical protein Q9160_008993 [Pyrenula sp. 1 TL-2023]